MPWVDTVHQQIEGPEFKEALIKMHECQHSNILVHCAQGKSRSATICIGYIAGIYPEDSVETITKRVQAKRAMAEPNQGFLDQLAKLWKKGYFQLQELKMHD